MITSTSFSVSRRELIFGAAALAAASALPSSPAFALPKKDVRKLRFEHTHTGESMDLVYFADGKYIKDGLKKANYLLRDFRNDKQKKIDPELLDRLVLLQRKLGSKGRFEIISAYRSPQTNKMLRRRSSGVAKNSFHLQGKAIDIRLTDVDLYTLRNAAVDLGGGGVGIYNGADFLHLDTGPERSWG
ncbi:MAG: DUF882 domain-containing protein [Rickettsiales bacterium]|jgi:uncharacterized protein YcbK (DUF882 family)|nr:DUF882 domain-containing protein [Rickettsiales bacterium]